MTLEITKNIVVSSRIRLARNLASLPFQGHLTDVTKARNAAKSIYQVLESRGFQLLRLKNAEQSRKQYFLEARKISKDLIDNSDISALIFSADEKISIMVHEEDHLRIQCVQDGFSLSDAYAKLDEVDEVLIKNLEIAYDNAFGFLTACPTNVGTGMRASIMLFLPVLTMDGNIANLIQAIQKLGLTVRGSVGEGSKAEGYLYQISNQITLGLTEAEIIASVNSAVLKICESEAAARKKLLNENYAELKDKSMRALGILSSCFSLSLKEFSELYAKLKFGMSLGFIDFRNMAVLDELEISIMPAHLSQIAGKNLIDAQCDEFRAEYVGKILREAVVKYLDI